MALLQAATAVFAPPVETPFRVVTERVETGASVRRFRLERLIRFAREGSGYRAEVVIVGVTSDTPEASGALYEAGFGALAGRRLVFRLDGAGRVIGIDDLPATWERICHGVADNAAGRRSLPPAERDALAQRIAAPLLMLPAERQRELLGSLVASLISDEGGEQIGTRPVHIPGTTPLGTATTLEGSRTLSAGTDGRMHSLTQAAAEAALPAEGAVPARSGRIAVEMQRDFDPRTGLLSRSVDTTVTTLGTGAEARETRRVTTLEATPIVAAEWPAN